jgi:antitoxin ParD1/3/4
MRSVCISTLATMRRSRSRLYISTRVTVDCVDQGRRWALPPERAHVGGEGRVSSCERARMRRLIATALRVLTARDRAVNRRLKNRVGPAYDALEADPLRAVTAAKVRARLASERKRAVPRKDAVER